jgi:hypothetical protein
VTQMCVYFSSRLSIDCFKSYIKCTQSFELFEYFNNEKVWDLLSQELTHIEGCTVLARGICLHANKNMQSVLQNLTIYLSAPYDCHKITVTAVLAEVREMLQMLILHAYGH